MPIELTWYGHSCWNIKTPKSTLLIDPFLTGNSTAPVTADQVKPDFILVSHGHGDHFGDTIAIAKRTGATVISNFEIANYCEAQGCQAHPLHIGGSHEFPFGRVKLTIAHHGSSFENGTYAGNPAGFLLTIDGKKIYHSGDTGLFYDMKLIGEQGIDLAMIPIGDNYTMGPDDAVRAATFIEPKVLIPMHYDTWELIHQDPNSFASRVKQAVPKTQVVVLKPGETYTLK
ncbi:MAG: metal-dependent hydrolase [Chloroflexi bacterium]|nr:metal-dependent hydrolase [Chloroflexota bacterium]